MYKQLDMYMYIMSHAYTHMHVRTRTHTHTHTHIHGYRAIPAPAGEEKEVTAPGYIRGEYTGITGDATIIPCKGRDTSTTHACNYMYRLIRGGGGGGNSHRPSYNDIGINHLTVTMNVYINMTYTGYTIHLKLLGAAQVNYTH